MSNNTLSGATSLTRINLSDNPIVSMGSHPFPPALSEEGVNMYNTLFIFLPERGRNGGTRPLCVAYSPVRNNRTLLCSDSGRSYCDLLLEVTALVDATQYVPPYSGAANRSYLTFGARTKWAIERTYHVMPVNYSGVALSDGNIVVGKEASLSVTIPPPGLFVDVSTGELLFVPQEEQNRTVSTPTAQHPDFPGVAAVGTVSFEVLFADVDNPAVRGPNNKSCSNGGTKTDGPDDGTAEFDLHTSARVPRGLLGPTVKTW